MTTFSQVIDNFFLVKQEELRPGSLALMRGNWKYLHPMIGDVDACQFGKAEALKLKAVLLDKGLSPKTVKDRLAFVRQVIRFANSHLGLETKSTEWNLRYDLKEPKKMQLFQEAEIMKLIKSAYKELKDGNPNALPILISAMTGMRVGEVCGLKWEDVDLKRRIITVRRTVSIIYDPDKKEQSLYIGPPKTISGFRDIPMLPLLKDVFKEMCPDNCAPDNFVVGNSSTPRSQKSVRDTYKCFLLRHKLPEVNFHGLRHTFATRLVESRVDLKTISTILGHSDVTTTLNLYVHPSADAKRKAVLKAFSKTSKMRKTYELTEDDQEIITEL